MPGPSLGEHQPARPPPNRRGKICWKLLVDHVERLLKTLAAGAIDFGDRVIELLERLLEVMLLLRQEVVALFDFFVLVDRGDVHFAHAFDLQAQVFEPCFGVGPQRLLRR